jgi:hypothetical protein
MKPYYLKILSAFLLISPITFAQEADNAAILKIIFSKYYKNEKVIAKGRLQLLSFYCQKAPNNEEVLEVVSKSELLKKNAAEVKKQIDITVNENWSAAYDILFDNQNQYLKSKVNACMSFEEYKVASDRLNQNNQRLMIVSKPIYFAKNTYALVKVAFYRNIEHNSGSFLLLQKVNDEWTVIQYLNEWAT